MCSRLHLCTTARRRLQLPGLNNREEWVSWDWQLSRWANWSEKAGIYTLQLNERQVCREKQDRVMCCWGVNTLREPSHRWGVLYCLDEQEMMQYVTLFVCLFSKIWTLPKIYLEGGAHRRFHLDHCKRVLIKYVFQASRYFSKCIFFCSVKKENHYSWHWSSTFARTVPR